ncbi:unnamed protein product [Tenebrio molitor]|nr:unnamed protein product [Tenebrio molitor]
MHSVKSAGFVVLPGYFFTENRDITVTDLTISNLKTWGVGLIVTNLWQKIVCFHC